MIPAASAQSVNDTAAPLLAECFRTLRSQILVRARSGLRTIMVASARPEEGKTTIALNLATTLAIGGRRVLLVDGDLRRPSLHRMLSLPNTVGFVDVLGGAQPLDAAVHQLKNGLSVVTSGRLTPDPQELLLGDRVDATLTEMKQAFDLVLIDTAPLLSVADAGLLAAHTDGVIVVIGYGLATVTEMRLTRERLAAAGGTLIGTVLNRFMGPAAHTYHPYAYSYSG